MQPRFVGRVGVADAVSVGNAVLGFLAVLAATVDPLVAARLVLVAAILDALDGLAARRFGSTPAGRPLDSLADVASFAVAPAVLVVAVARDAGVADLGDPGLATAAAVAAAAAFVAAAVLRLALYTVEEAGSNATDGVQSTLAGTIIAAAVLSGVTAPVVLLGATALLSYFMVVPVQYPDLRARDAFAVGVVQALAVLVPGAAGRLLPRVVLALSLSYFALAPFLYPGPDGGERLGGDPAAEERTEHGAGGDGASVDDGESVGGTGAVGDRDGEDAAGDGGGRSAGTEGEGTDDRNPGVRAGSEGKR